ncbi:MAG: response regulator, partial [Gemmatimonadetes bacterium]|nr:response regulator [Gemmatimonadota bacterium]
MTRIPTILLVDDDDPFRAVMAGELGHRGFQVTAADCGKEALKQLEEEQPDILLLDLQLPDMSGLEVLEEAEKKSPGSEVIMLTGHGSMDTAIEAIRKGAFDYVSKPCPLDELEVRIQRALDHQALNRRTSV